MPDPPNNVPTGDATPPVINAPPPSATASNPATESVRNVVSILLSLFLAVFLADAILSLADNSLIVFFDLHLLSGLQTLVGYLALFMALVIYVLMGLTPMIPKSKFLPVALFDPAVILLVFPFLIYFYDRMPRVLWWFSLCQVVLGLGILWWVQGGFKFRWRLVTAEQLQGRSFSWLNLCLFLLANAVVLPVGLAVYFVVCAALALGHFSDGFMALRPWGLQVQARKYSRSDGKTIQLFPMSHIADAAFYKKILQSVPTNSITLMEGVTDEKNHITNQISYSRMARTLGLSEQHEDFHPSQGERVRADVDIDDFSTNTIDVLNTVMFIHSKGLNLETLQQALQLSVPPDLQDQLFADLLTRRNQHLLGEIQDRLSQTDHIIVPWGAAHMPGLAREIQKSGFHLVESRDYVVIRFGPALKE